MFYDKPDHNGMIINFEPRNRLIGIVILNRFFISFGKDKSYYYRVYILSWDKNINKNKWAFYIFWIKKLFWYKMENRGK